MFICFIGSCFKIEHITHLGSDVNFIPITFSGQMYKNYQNYETS